MTMNEMRKYVSDSYPGVGWKSKVAVMPERQVVAVYKSLINRKPKAAVKTVLAAEADPYMEVEPHQIDIWEYLYSIQE